MSRFWSSFAAAAVGATLWAGSAAAGGYGAPSAPCGPAPAPCGPAAFQQPVFQPPVFQQPVGPNCGPGYAPPIGHPGGFYGYRPAPPPPVCTTEIQWQTTYRSEQRCHETWREVSIPVSRASSVPGTCGPNQVCQQDVFRIKVPHCEPRTVTVPVSNPVRVTICRQPDVNSCGVVGQPLEDRRWSDRWDRNDRWDRWDDKRHGGFGRDDWRRPSPPPIHNPGPYFPTGSISNGPAFGPSYAGPTTNYRAARTSLSVDLTDAAPASSTVSVVAEAPVVEAAPAPVASGSTQWLPY